MECITQFQLKKKGVKLTVKKSMTLKTARRIQSSQDKKASKGDQGFKSRAMSIAVKSSKKK